MPRMDGFEVLEGLHGDDTWREVPVIIVTAKDLTREDVERLNGRAVKVLQGRLPATGPGPRHSHHDRAPGRAQLTPSGSSADRSLRERNAEAALRRGQRDEPRHAHAVCSVAASMS